MLAKSEGVPFVKGSTRERAKRVLSGNYYYLEDLNSAVCNWHTETLLQRRS